MDGGSEAELGGSSAAPLWKRRATPRQHGRGKPRPQSYQSPSGVLVTDFPVEDRCAFTVTQPAETICTRPPRTAPPCFGSEPAPAPNGTLRPPGCPEQPPRLPSPGPAGPLGLAENGTAAPQGRQPARGSRRAPSPLQRSAASPGPQLPAAGNELSPSGGQPGQPYKNPQQVPAGPAAVSRAISPEQDLTPQGPAPEGQLPEQPAVVLSTNSPAALKVGTQQLIPRSLASDIKVTSKSGGHNAEANRRVLKVRSMVESLSVPLVADAEEEAEGDLDSPGALRRGLRSTSYRRAVVSGIDFDSSSNFKKKNRMSQPILKAVVEDKEKFSSLGRTKVSCAEQ